jgi:aminopeptidase N
VTRRDPHSYTDDAQPRVRALHWRVRVDVAARVLDGEATYEVDRGGVLDLDARGQAVIEARGLDGAALPCEVGPTDPILGNRVRVTLPDAARGFVIRHQTAREPAALGFAAGCVYALNQPIHARTLVPLPDTPRARLRITVDAEAPGRVIASRGEDVPSYLLTLIAGDFVERELSPRIRLYAAPSVIEAAVRVLDFAGELLGRAEKLYGPYPWPRFDLAVMPPMFPYGGMEGPTVAMLSPTVLEDETDARRVVAHELMHGWFGNSVTAAGAEHLWLNEGWTVWAERRLLDDEPAWSEGGRALDALVAELDPPRTVLRQSLAGKPPEEAASMIAYEKGALLIRALEQAAGPQFEDFTRAYLAHFANGAVDSDEFRRFTDENLPGHGVDLSHWLEAPSASVNANANANVNVNANEAEQVLRHTGRLQHIRPIWLALAKQDPAKAASLYRALEAGYHPLARKIIQTLLARAGVAIRETNPLSLKRR